MKQAYEILAYKSEKNFDNRNFEVFDSGITNKKEALKIAKGQVNNETYFVFKVQSSDREFIELVYTKQAEIVAAQKLFGKTAKVVSKKGNTILSAKRHWDERIIKVGDKTKSGGKILSINLNKRAVGGMDCEIGSKGVFTAISCISYE